VIVWPVLFPTAYEVFLSRWVGAWADEIQLFQYGVFGRAFQPFYAFIEYLPSMPFFGYLLGIGGNASIRLDWVRLPSVAYEWSGYGAWGLEGGWAVHLIELGILGGLFFIIWRVGLVLWLGWKVCKCTYYCGNPVSALLFGYVGIVILIMQFTIHGTMNGFAWMLFGFCLSAVRIYNCSSGKIGYML